MRFIPILSVLFIFGCASSKEGDAPETTVVTRQYTNINIVGKDVTTEERKSAQAGAALTTDRYEVVLSKKQFEYADNTDFSNNKNDEVIESNNSKNDSKKDTKKSTTNSEMKQKDESVYKKRDESMYRKQ